MVKGDLDSFYSFLDHLPIAALVISFEEHQVDDLSAQKICHVNFKYLELIGYPLSATPDAASWMQLAYPQPEYRQEITNRWKDESAAAMQRDDVTAKAIVNVRCNDGRNRCFEAFSEVRSTILPNHYIISFIDITDMTVKMEGLKRQSVMDQLTGVYNQYHLLQRVEQEIERAVSSDSYFTLMMFDLDFFKMINDRYGYECGDQVLISCASMINEVLSSEDCLARWNGADFIVLIREGNSGIARQVIQKALQKIRAHTFLWQDISFAMTATIGLTTYQSGDNADKVLERADLALKRGKQMGGDFVFMDITSG
ncbi:GGDEF domain-containing protein [Amphritea japonica]|uniref:diguanylate cyclase n=1 Tax=Amphritea japonica ATCC BAA-1530 TaxID=1278309 RepID=A0A7R6PAP5_9GAMM|nr:GGDEF domain-containing protein [Amphritea japonica]BBB25656.1 signal transduction protein [Amphritea japonica ATCC BAA-1530]